MAKTWFVAIFSLWQTCHPLHTVRCQSLLQAPLPNPVTLDSQGLQNPAMAAWLNRNLCRVRHLVLRTDEAASLPRLCQAAALQELRVEDCPTLKQLPAGLAGLQHLTALRFNKW